MQVVEEGAQYMAVLQELQALLNRFPYRWQFGFTVMFDMEQFNAEL